jgi:hypothetical protein
LNNKLGPIILKAKKGEIKTFKGMTYLEMKYNLLISYCTFLSFYLLLKVEGKSVEDHPVIFKLAHIKTLLEKLRPLDQKLQYQVDKMLREAALIDSGNYERGEEEEGKQADNLKFKPNPKGMKKVNKASKMIAKDDSESDDDEGGAGGILSDESEIEDDMDAGDMSFEVKNPADFSSGDDEEGEGKASESEDEGVKNQKTQIYKAAKLNPVYYDDKETKNQRREEQFQRKKASRTEYVDELRKEMHDLPEERQGFIDNSQRKAFMKEQNELEELEMNAFKRKSLSKMDKKKFNSKS